MKNKKYNKERIGLHINTCNERNILCVSATSSPSIAVTLVSWPCHVNLYTASLNCTYGQQCSSFKVAILCSELLGCISILIMGRRQNTLRFLFVYFYCFFFFKKKKSLFYSSLNYISFFSPPAPAPIHIFSYVPHKPHL